MSEKPILFVSHSSKDGHIANVIKEQLEAVLDIEVFETSHFSAIEGGQEWFEVITQKLDKAKALFVLCSYHSRFSQWVQWEIGYFHKRNAVEMEKLPIYVATVAGEKPFATIEANQAKSLNDENETLSLLQTIGKYFDAQFDSRKIALEIQKVAPVHIFDNGAKEKLRDYLKLDYQVGRWIEYAELDKQLNIALGMSKLHIKQIVEEDALSFVVEKPEDETDNGVRLSHPPNPPLKIGVSRYA